MNQINWNEAPEDATHYIESRHGMWWVKVEDDGSYHHRMLRGDKWKHDLKNFLETYGNDNWKIITRPQVQPKQQGEHKMFTAKQLKDTYPHKQMRLYIEATVDDANKRPAALGQLVKKFMTNCVKQWPGLGIPDSVDEAFTWGMTPEGHGFWSKVNDQRPKKEAEVKPLVVDIEAHAFARFDAAAGVAVPPPAPAAKKKEDKPAPKPAVGWW